MATDFTPPPGVTFAAVLEATAGPPFACELHHAVSTGEPVSFSLGLLGGEDYLHAYATEDGGVVFSRYGHNDVEPILRALEGRLGVRIGPEHERTPVEETTP